MIELRKECIEVSVIIPARNEGTYLEQCLESIQQTLRDVQYEIIVVDNNSTDNTSEIAHMFNCQILQNSRKGAASSRNAGASLAKGQFLAFIDADCILHEQWFGFTREHFNNTRTVAVGTKISPDFSRATWVEKTVFRMNKRRGSMNSGNALKVKWLGTSNILLKKEAFDKAGGFDEALITCEDYDLCERLAPVGDILLDTRIHTIHLRESKTLRELFRRELWRGQNSLSHWSKGGFQLYEAPSIILPFGFLLCCFLGISLLVFNGKIAIAFLSLGLCAPLLITIRSKSILSGFLSFGQSFMVASTYLLARGFALLKEFLEMIFMK